MVHNYQETSGDLHKKISKIVDAAFTERILRESENDSKLRVRRVSIEPATSKGDGYMSDIFRVTAEYTRQNGKRSVSEKKSLIVKVEPLIEGAHQNFISHSTVFSTEISMMTDTLPQMNELLGPDSPSLNGRGLYTQRQSPPLLVIEDLAPLGFRKADRHAGLDMDHCLLAIRNLARFHASSIALFERDPSQKSRFTCGLFDDRQPLEIRLLFEQGAKHLAKESASWPGLDSRISEKLSKLPDSIYEKGIKVTACRENEFNVLNHGDFSANNMLFKYNDSNRPVQQIFVDFQECLYTSPAIDLHCFFNTSLTDDTLMLNEETLIDEYTRMLASSMSKMNCTTEPPSLEQVKTMLWERSMYGLIVSIGYLPFILVSTEEATELNELLENDENPAYKSKLYREVMTRRLPKFDQMGLLD